MREGQEGESSEEGRKQGQSEKLLSAPEGRVGNAEFKTEVAAGFPLFLFNSALFRSP